MLFLGCAIVVLAIFLFIVLVFLSLDSKKTSKGDLKLVIDGKVSLTETAQIWKGLNYMPATMQKSVRKIVIRLEKDYFVYEHNNKQYTAAGFYEGDGEISILREELTWKIIWHEVAHAYVYMFLNRKKFLSEWGKIAGDVYDPNDEDYIDKPMYAGMVSAYSRRNAGEDAAEWVQECYAYLYYDDKDKSSLTTNKYLKVDPRYRKKLNYLYQHGFFSKEDYKKLLPLFI